MELYTVGFRFYQLELSSQIMVCYPEMLKAVQAELDKALNGRHPEHSDFPSCL